MAQGQRLTVAEERQQQAKSFRGDLQRMEGQVAAALPSHIRPEQFIRVAITAVTSDPSLLTADRQSLFEACMRSAQDGLLPDKREGALVIFNNKVQWMPMIGGILKKIRNSGELKSIRAHVVFEGDEFEYALGDEERIEHRPIFDGDRGKVRCAYAIAETKDGGIYREVMSFADIEKVRKVSRAATKGPWVDWWEEMARKTVLRRLAKRLPMSTDLAELFRRDDALYDLRGRGEPAPGFRPVQSPLLDAPERDTPAEGDQPLVEDGTATVVQPPPSEGDERDPDFGRGFSDGEKGTGKCLNAEIQADPARLAKWQAGHRAGTAARQREEAA
ncbi:recombinase RecT [Methylobacterium sp. 1973]|uniref:recombinase RecT n=1 Tax=Methylobacterium sp. 1973 TaxID=3156421 RepID=UPI0033913694